MAKKHNWQKRGKSVQLQVYAGTDYKGRPKRYTKTIPYTTDRKMDKAWEDFRRDIEDGLVFKRKRTSVSDMCQMVTEEVLSKSLKRTSLQGYKSARKKIDETIGARFVSDIKPFDIQQWVNELSETLSPKTVKNYYSFLKRCFDTFAKWEEIPQSPCRYIDLPTISKQEVEIIHKEDLRKLLTALDTIPREQYDYKVAILLALFGGLRRAEICGLRESDVDLDTGRASIVQTLNLDASGPFEDTPKTKSSVRTVYYPPGITAEIRNLVYIHKEMQLRLGSKWAGSDKLIKGQFGKDMYPDNLWHFLARFLKAHDLPHVSFHALRHTYTSMLADLDIPLSQISKSLGHAQQSTTLDIYSHLFSDPDKAKKEIANRLASAYSK